MAYFDVKVQQFVLYNYSVLPFFAIITLYNCLFVIILLFVYNLKMAADDNH